jgi:hypothetical protein
VRLVLAGACGSITGEVITGDATDANFRPFETTVRIVR